MPVLTVALGYLVGSIPFAYLVARRARGIDIRAAGSGNAGAANVLRTSGVGSAVSVLALDLVKGACAVLIAQRLQPGDPAPAAAAGVAAVVGHIYPVWLRFRGGKGVATACGAFGLLVPQAIAPAIAVFVLAVWATRYVSLGSVLASVALGPLAWASSAPAPVVAAGVATAALVVFRHRSNLARIRRGEERRIAWRVSA